MSGKSEEDLLRELEHLSVVLGAIKDALALADQRPIPGAKCARGADVDIDRLIRLNSELVACLDMIGDLVSDAEEKINEG